MAMVLQSSVLQLAALAALASGARAESGTLVAPAETPAGSSFEVKWNGPAVPGAVVSRTIAGTSQHMTPWPRSA